MLAHIRVDMGLYLSVTRLREKGPFLNLKHTTGLGDTSIIDRINMYILFSREYPVDMPQYSSFFGLGPRSDNVSRVVHPKKTTGREKSGFEHWGC